MTQADPSFAARLDEALTLRDLTLERVAARLAARGERLSVSTLSLWRRGRTVPRRAAALEAVAALEEVLDLPAGHLTDAARTAAPGTPRWWSAPTEVQSIPHHGIVAAEFRDELGLGDRDDFHMLLTHEVVRIDDRRRLARVEATDVVRATRDGCERMILTTFSSYRDEDGEMVLRIPHLHSGGRVGRVRERRDTGHVGWEIIFDRRLQAGETVVLEYDVVPERPEPPEVQNGRVGHDIYTGRPLKEITLEAVFAVQDPPTRVWSSRVTDRRQDLDTAEETEVPLINGSASASMRWMTGGLRLGWTWES